MINHAEFSPFESLTKTIKTKDTPSIFQDTDSNLILSLSTDTITINSLDILYI